MKNRAILILVTYPLVLAQEVQELKVVTVIASSLEDREAKVLDRSETGSRKLTRKEIEALGDASGDPNELLEILPNVQFDDRRGRLNADTAGDLTPAEISISGGRFYENNFIVDGVSTNSLLDTVSQRSFDNTVGDTQSVFLDADLLKQFEAIDSNVSAEYGQFLGGVVRAETRDPKDQYSLILSSQYSSSDWVQYLIMDEDLSDPLPGETEFARMQHRVALDMPLSEKLSALVAYTRAEADVTRGALSSAYFAGQRTRTTVKDNYLAKLRYEIDETSVVTLQTLLTPYENEYFRTNLARQFGGGSSSRLNWNKKLESSVLDFSLSYTTTENSRDEDPSHFIFTNTESIDWIADTRNSGSLGGFGNLDVSQESLQLDFKHTTDLENSAFSYGLQASHVNAVRSRPVDSFGYRGALKTFGLPISGSNLDDGSIIQNEQFLTERNDYRAFDAEADILQLGVFSEFRYEAEIEDWLTIIPKVGVRYEYDDFLGNHNFAPRTSLRFDLPKDISFTAGFSRYFGKNQLAYKLREENPDSFIYRRGYDFDGSQFILRDFELIKQRRFTTFANGDLNTPYSDEVSLALTLPMSELGEFRVKAIQRDNRDGLARSEPILDSAINELGQESEFDRYELTNRGASEFRSISLEWSKQCKNHRFTASTSFSENIIAPGTDNFFSNTNIELEDERVFYNGDLMDYSDLEVQRSNFNVPFFVAFGWVSTWLDDRLTLGFRGRFRDSYETVNFTGDTVDENGNPGGGFDLYEDIMLKTQFIIDSSINYRWETERFGDISLDLRIDNLFSRIPNVPVSIANPYQLGRMYSLGAKIQF